MFCFTRGNIFLNEVSWIRKKILVRCSCEAGPKVQATYYLSSSRSRVALCPSPYHIWSLPNLGQLWLYCRCHSPTSKAIWETDHFPLIRSKVHSGSDSDIKLFLGVVCQWDRRLGQASGLSNRRCSSIFRFLLRKYQYRIVCRWWSPSEPLAPPKAPLLRFSAWVEDPYREKGPFKGRKTCQ